MASDEYMDDAESAAARKLGEAVDDFCRTHEKKFHEGRACVDNRISVTAYLAFGLNIFNGGIEGLLEIMTFQRLLAAYRRAHDEHLAEQAEKN